MIWTEAKGHIRDWLVSVAKVPAERVIYADQRGDRPDKPYLTIKPYGPKIIGEFDMRTPDSGDTIDDFLMTGQMRVLCSINCFSDKDPLNKVDDPSAIQIMETILQSLELPSVYNTLFANGISVNGNGDVQNLTELLEDVFEERAQLDVTFGYAANVGDSPGTIESVEIKGAIKSDSSTPQTVVPIDYEVPET